MEKRFKIMLKETDEILERTPTKEEAEELIRDYEDEDKQKGRFKPNTYEVGEL